MINPIKFIKCWIRNNHTFVLTIYDEKFIDNKSIIFSNKTCDKCGYIQQRQIASEDFIKIIKKGK
jgi:hypothetical protein